MRDSRSWNQTKAVDACMNEDDLGEAVRQGSLVKERIKAMNYAAEVAGLFDREPHPRSRNGRRR
jgi:hypothetical protein